MKYSKKLVFISNMAAPYQIKMAKEMNKYLETQYWFYEYIDDSRPSWWKLPLEKNTIILSNVKKIFGKYFSSDIKKRLNSFDPDIVMLGGFSIPGNYFAYRWAKKNNKKTVVFTELTRDRHGKLRTKSIIWKILRYLYKDVDNIFAPGKEAVNQFKEIFATKEKVIRARYGSDIDGHLAHNLRDLDKDKIYLLFANRLTKIYEPLLALEIFNNLRTKYDNLYLRINAEGELRDECEKYIKKNQLDKYVSFLDSINSWDDLPKIYEQCDILYLPASFSNGNFTIIEAMASGMGIVISDKVNGHSDMMEDKKNCFICKSNIEDFSNAITKYIQNKELIKEHGKINKSIVNYRSIAGTSKFFIEKFEELGLLK
jgi:glycosyltransferase involved in cell wall biosynthesis